MLLLSTQQRSAFFAQHAHMSVEETDRHTHTHMDARRTHTHTHTDIRNVTRTRFKSEDRRSSSLRSHTLTFNKPTHTQRNELATTRECDIKTQN